MPKLNNFSFDNKIIARGFTSVVYKGLDDNTKQKVAIKCIDESILDDQSKKKMLTNQLNLQWELKSQPYIVEIKAQFYQNDCIYIVTEFCEYGDLKSKIKQKGKFVQPKAVSYMLDIIKGFQTLFKHNIVHRDLKPANILISKKGVKIGDFGFAYKIVQNQKAEQVSVPSAGSPLYMAPQVLEDGRNSSFSSDVWSIGVVFFEMLTGRLPFPAKNKEALIKLIDKIGIRTIIPQNVSLKSKQFLLRTLKKDPAKRMTAQELIAFEFDEEILFKLKQHRLKKAEQLKRKQQEDRVSTSSEQKLSSQEKQQVVRKIQKSQTHSNHSKNHNNPQVQKQRAYQNIKQHEPEKPQINHHPTPIHSDHSSKISNMKPPELGKNKTTFEQFDFNLHKGKNLLDPHDIQADKFKRKSKDKPIFVDELHSEVSKDNKHAHFQHVDKNNNKKEVQVKSRSAIQQKHSSHDEKQYKVQDIHRFSHTKYHGKEQSQFTKQINKLVNNFQNVKENRKLNQQKKHSQKIQNTSHHIIHQHTTDNKKHEEIFDNKKPTEKIKRADSVLSVQQKNGEHHWIKKQQIIQILLNQIDIIRFLSRIMHKIQELHKLHIPQHHSNGDHQKRSPSRHSSQSKQSHDGSSKRAQFPVIYIQLKQLIYKTIMQIQKLDFLPDQQAYKFFRSQQFDQIKIILDTYKTKLQLVAIKTNQWKGLKAFEHELEIQILMVYKAIKERIIEYENHHFDSQSRQLKKLTRKIQALNYLIVLRYDYLIMQREQVFINESANNKNGKYSQECSHIKAIIEDKHSKSHDSKKSIQECKIDLKAIEKKMKQIKLI